MMANNPALTAYINMVLRFGFVNAIAARDERIRQLEADNERLRKVIQWQNKPRRTTGRPQSLADAYYQRKLQQWAAAEFRRRDDGNDQESRVIESGDSVVERA